MTDRRMERTSYKDVRIHLVNLVNLLLLENIQLSISLVLNESVTDEKLDGRTDRPTNGEKKEKIRTLI